MRAKFVLMIIVMMAAVMFSAGCTDDVRFSSDKHDRLAFSADTLSFDTIFSGQLSHTASLVVYNRNSDALRFDVSLMQGASSPFFLNADGQTGPDACGVELRGGDSLFCFISVNPDETDSDIPVLLQDSLVFRMQSGLVQTVLLMAYGQDVIILDGCTFLSDTVLSAGRPYLLYDTVTVSEGTTLSVLPGAELCFHDGAALRVSGRIMAVGLLSEPIVMHGDRRDNMLSGLPYDLVAGRWGGIAIDSCSYGNLFEFCHIYGGEWGIKADTASLVSQKVAVRNCLIHNVSGNALELCNSIATVENSQITNAGNYCVNILGGDNVFSFCTIANYYPWTVHAEAVYISNVCDSTVFPVRRAAFRGCIITGSSSDEISGIVVDSLDGYSMDELANYWVWNSLVMSPDTLNRRLSGNVFENRDYPGYSNRNFKHVAMGDFRYDFRLDSVSPARFAVTDADLLESFPTDMAGHVRGTEKADAGCYQYE